MSNDLTKIKQRNNCEHCKYSKDLKEYILCLNESVDKNHDMLKCNLYEPKNLKRKKVREDGQ